MKCWSFVHSIAVIRISASFPSFPMPKSNLMMFGRNYFRASYLFIYYENHTQSTVIKKQRLEIHWSTLNTHCTLQKATLYLLPVIAAKAESLVTDIVRFPIIAQSSKGVHYFHRVVGLEVINIRQWFLAPGVHLVVVWTVCIVQLHKRGPATAKVVSYNTTRKTKYGQISTLEIIFSVMHGCIWMEVIAATHYQVHMTRTTCERSRVQRSGSQTTFSHSAFFWQRHADRHPRPSRFLVIVILVFSTSAVDCLWRHAMHWMEC